MKNSILMYRKDISPKTEEEWEQLKKKDGKDSYFT